MVTAQTTTRSEEWMIDGANKHHEEGSSIQHKQDTSNLFVKVFTTFSNELVDLQNFFLQLEGSTLHV